MKRILHVVGGMNRGGVETWLMHVLRNIDRDRLKMDFLVHTSRECAYDDEIRRLGSPIIACLEPSKPWQYSRRFRSALVQYGPYDVVHSHVHFYSGLHVAMAHWAGVPARISHSHNTHDGRPSSLDRIAYRAAMRCLIRRYATHLLCAAPASGQALFGQESRSDPRFQVLRYGIDLTPYSALPLDRRALRRELSLPETGCLIGHVGRFDPQKNHLFLVKVFSALVDQMPEAHLVLTGEGGLRDEINSLVQQLDLRKKVTFLGLRSDIPRIMGALDAFLFPSQWEGLPVAVTEAQAAGVPCIVSEGVPRDSDVGLGLLTYVSLRSGLPAWVDAVRNSLAAHRPAWNQRECALRAAGCDIRLAVPALEKIYVAAPR